MFHFVLLNAVVLKWNGVVCFVGNVLESTPRSMSTINNTVKFALRLVLEAFLRNTFMLFALFIIGAYLYEKVEKIDNDTAMLKTFIETVNLDVQKNKHDVWNIDLKLKSLEQLMVSKAEDSDDRFKQLGLYFEEISSNNLEILKKFVDDFGDKYYAIKTDITKLQVRVEMIQEYIQMKSKDKYHSENQDAAGYKDRTYRERKKEGKGYFSKFINGLKKVKDFTWCFIKKRSFIRCMFDIPEHLIN